MDKETNIEAKIEAVLFVHGEPIKLKKLSSVVGVSEQKIKEGLDQIKQSLQEKERGLDLILNGDQVQLVTSPELSYIVEKLTKEELDTKLTPASLETLSIVAYLGPCSRALIEFIRGVNSAFILRSLMIRGLVERKSDLERAHNYVYQVTFDFLKHMGVSSSEELPDYDKYRELAKVFTGNDENENSN
jgi:segregation and condensation protein B